ncbi:MAG: right-handed parallel beta-helix repeat-containing protein [Bacteroidales bacterium]|nr:right-handed parallel beta-helix repeat-containing protein [Bacteroidales bacterium]
MRNSLIAVLSGFLLIIFLSDCQNDGVMVDDFQLGFSADTVYFDTVLTTLGSVTHHFQIYNPENQPVEIDHIFLARGQESFFRLNLDGTPGREFSKVIIPARDSLFLFVELTIDPLDESNPVLIKDSVVFETKSGLQDVKLLAYGQDVHVFNGEIFKTQTWTKEKPYLIVNSAALDTNEVLTIEPGTKIYLTSTSSLLIWGQIQAHGTYDEPIIFSGARFDGRYEESAGQWRTLYIAEGSKDNVLEHVIIRNATAGIQVGYPDREKQAAVELRNCMILNSSSLGIFSFNSIINAYNTVIADCGSIGIYIQMGGTYNFYHCTLSNVSAYYPDFFENAYKARSLPTLMFKNYFEWYDFDEEFRYFEDTLPGDVEVNFYNSIIYGTSVSEIYFKKNDMAGMSYLFDHTLMKLHADSLKYFNPAQMVSNIYNRDPGFLNDSIVLGDYDFNLSDTSVAIDAGSLVRIQGIPQLEYDFTGKLRTVDGAPDLGAYEYE